MDSLCGQNGGSETGVEPGKEAPLLAFSIVALLTAVGMHRRWFLGAVVAVVALALAWALLLNRTYKATTMLLPPQQQTGAMAALAQLGALAGIASQASGLKSPDEMYVAFLKTDRLLDAMVRRFDLQARYKTDTPGEARLVLGANTRVVPDKKAGLIAIEVKDREAAFAAKLANGYFEELKTLVDRLAVTEAQQRRLFFEQQVARAKESLSVSEAAFRSIQERSGLLVPQALAETGIRASIEARTEIAKKEIQLRVARSFATEQNPEVLRLLTELDALRDQLARIEQGSGMVAKESGESQGVRILRDMKVNEAVLETVVKQYEMARLDEAREGPLLQLVDPALVPERHAGPSMLIVLLGGLLFGVVLGAALAWARATWLVARRRHADQWLRLRRAWGLTPDESS